MIAVIDQQIAAALAEFGAKENNHDQILDC
jgi:hypothetical protein